MNSRAAVLHSMGLERPYNISQPLKIENVNFGSSRLKRSYNSNKSCWIMSL